jgi:uncharacterized membrane protein YdjX (TVP38/TMEM64 family)
VPVPDPATPEDASPPAGQVAHGLDLARRFGPLAVLVAALIAVWASGLTHDLSLHMLRARREALEAAVHAHPLLALASYVSIYVLVVALSLPAALVMTLTGGLLFGAWIGGFAAAVSCTLGAAIIFIICRTAVGDSLRRRAGSTVARIEEGVRRDAFSYVVTLRLIPIMPFWLANLALGFVDIPLGVFVTASFIGILPVSVIYAGLGSNLNLLFARHQRPDLHLVMRPEVLAPLIGLAILALTPILLRRLRRPGSAPET